MSCSTITADALAAHDRGDGVHDLALVAGGDAAGRLVEEQELRLQGIGQRHVQQLALALGEIAGVVVAFGGETELAEDAVGLALTASSRWASEPQMRGLALAGEDRQRHVVERQGRRTR